MKKLTNKKGFTIVELVIVIAVIAILAAVLIPTFSSVIHNANASACMQEAKSAYVEAYADILSDNSGNLPTTAKVVIKNGWAFKFDSTGLAGLKYIGTGFTENDDGNNVKAALKGSDGKNGYADKIYEIGNDKDGKIISFESIKAYTAAKYANGYKGTYKVSGDITVEYNDGKTATVFTSSK